MKKTVIKYLIWTTFIALIFINIIIFVSGIKLSDEISYFEKEISVYHQQNVELEKQKSTLGSLQYAASIAAVLDFSKKSQPVFLESLQYAMNK